MLWEHEVWFHTQGIQLGVSIFAINLFPSGLFLVGTCRDIGWRLLGLQQTWPCPPVGIFSHDLWSYYSQCHVVLLKCTYQNVNNQTHTQVSQLHVHVFFCLKVIRSWLNIPTGGHGHGFCRPSKRQPISLQVPTKNRRCVKSTLYAVHNSWQM